MSNIQLTFSAIIVVWIAILIIVALRGKIENNTKDEKNKRTNYSGLG